MARLERPGDTSMWTASWAATPTVAQPEISRSPTVTVVSSTALVIACGRGRVSRRLTHWDRRITNQYFDPSIRRPGGYRNAVYDTETPSTRPSVDVSARNVFAFSRAFSTTWSTVLGTYFTSARSHLVC